MFKGNNFVCILYVVWPYSICFWRGITQCDSQTMSEKQWKNEIEPVHEISINVVCATSKASDQPAHMCSLIRSFASRLRIL